MSKPLFFFLVFSVHLASAQTGIIKGRVYNSLNNEPIPFVSVGITGTSFGASTDTSGWFQIRSLSPGLYNLEVSFVGFKKKVIFEVQVTNAKPAMLEIPLEEEAKNLDEVVVSASPFSKTKETPLSLRNMGVAEIERYPGGNRDISKAIQSLPGVASSASFRNDIIIRGGSPNENRFYIDEFEVPGINHFSTQGASGGPVGMLNINLIKEVDLLSGAFPANRGNALSSVFEFKLKDGRTDKKFFQATIGASDLALASEGPLSKKTTYLFSVRRSYLQFLFQALQLPFLPTYNDFMIKTKTKINDKNEFTVFGLGAIDNLKLNKEANETEQQQYILGNIPVNNQWNYTVGVKWKHFKQNGFTTYVLSRNMLNNEAYKYENNDESNPDGLILKYKSQEIENKFRLENYSKHSAIGFTYGISIENIKYNNSTYNRITTQSGLDTVRFTSAIEFFKYAFFAQANKTFFEDRLSLSAGVRADGNSYSNIMSNPFQQLGPRLSVSYAITSDLSFNFNTGMYYQAPSYTVLGFKDFEGRLINKENKVRYILSKHIVAGLEYMTSINTKFSIEGFYKQYSKYPLSVKNGVSLANLGADFGVIGNEAVTSASDGRSYGIEFLAQQKLFKGFFGIIAYTFVRSEFTNNSKKYNPSAWDNRHIVSITAGKKFKKSWDLGMRWRFYGGTPYTPYNVKASALKSNWDVSGRGISDYSLVNTLRLPAFHNLDVRVDKKYYLKHISLNFYVDVQNVYNFQSRQADILTVNKDLSGNALVDENDPQSYSMKTLRNTSGTILPTLGIIVDF